MIALDDSGHVVRMIEEMVDQMNRHFRLVEAVPFLQAAAGGGKGIVRVERQQHELVEGRAVERGDGLRSVRTPVAHGHDGARGNMRAQRRFESARLLLREAANRRASADFGVCCADGFRARGGDQLRQRLAREKRAGEIDDVGIAETDCRETARRRPASPGRPAETRRRRSVLRQAWSR